jgi:cysteine desulfurase/selenocysteine lyase
MTTTIRTPSGGTAAPASRRGPLDPAEVRCDFPILEREMNGKRLIYLDSASSSQKPRQVLEAMDDYYTKHNANVHRSVYALAEESTRLFE